jgi:prolyl-tRNA editing enzyme YbaK/EbsC (Cys-tRNA(Pro) deacylase)
VDSSFVGNPEMVFNAGTHTDALCMHYNDFAEIVRPTVGTFAKPLQHRGEYAVHHH